MLSKRASNSSETLSFWWCVLVNLIKTLSIPRAEPKRPNPQSAAAAEATNAVTIDPQLAGKHDYSYQLIQIL